MNKKEYKYTFTMCNGKDAVVTRDNKFDMVDLIKNDWLWIGDDNKKQNLYLKTDNIVSIVEEEV